MASTTWAWLDKARSFARRAFAEREIFYRSHGEVRFIRISSRAQKLTAGCAALALIGWCGGTLAMLSQQVGVAQDKQALATQQAQVARQARTVNAYKRSVSEVTQDLDRRQDMLDELVRSQFGGQALDSAVVGTTDSATGPGPGNAASPAPALTPALSPAKTSSALPAMDKLRALETRQLRFARQLSALVDQRAGKVEAAIRSFGLNPQAMIAGAARGGPYIPWSRELGEVDDAFISLSSALSRLNALETGLAAIPSGRPTNSPSLTSSYGYRRDPFTGAPAFHAGLDFPGAHGQPILAAAAGRVRFVGVQQGYGNCVEVDHGNGIMTRYAHVSRFGVRVGQDVPRGAEIARMGSTGRSTGTHLHFEVRVNGAPINPRRFLEANQDVLQTQQVAKQRVSAVRVASRHGG